MFTIKLYQDTGRQKIMAADSFTILRGGTNPSEADESARINAAKSKLSDDERRLLGVR